MSFAIVSIYKAGDKYQLNNGIGQYYVDYDVMFTGTFSSAALKSAAGGAGLPVANAAHPSDSVALVKQIDITRHEDSPGTGTTSLPGLAHYNVIYSTVAAEAIDPSIAPWDRTATIEIEALGQTIVRRQDSEGNWYVNSVGDFYGELPETPVPGVRVTITRNEQDNPLAAVLLVSNTVASGGYSSCPNPKAKMGDITASKTSEVFEGASVDYWVVKYPIDCTTLDDGWHSKLIDNGFRIINDDGDPVLYRDKDGNTPSEPVPLDGSGNALEPGDDPVFFPEDGFKPMDEVDWSSLALPDAFA